MNTEYVYLCNEDRALYESDDNFISTKNIIKVKNELNSFFNLNPGLMWDIVNDIRDDITADNSNEIDYIELLFIVYTVGLSTVDASKYFRCKILKEVEISNEIFDAVVGSPLFENLALYESKLKDVVKLYQLKLIEKSVLINVLKFNYDMCNVIMTNHDDVKLKRETLCELFKIVLPYFSVDELIKLADDSKDRFYIQLNVKKILEKKRNRAYFFSRR